jgi:hypothetical protein
MEKGMPKVNSEGDIFESDTSNDGRHPDDITILKSYKKLRQTKLIKVDGSTDGAVNDTRFHHQYERAPTLSSIESILNPHFPSKREKSLL